MPKLIKVKIYYKEEGNSIIHKDKDFDGYPGGWEPKKFHEIAYGNNAEDMGRDGEGKFKYIVAICKDDTYAQNMLSSHPDRIEFIETQEAKNWGDKYFGGKEFISDHTEVIRILSKVNKGEGLNPSDLDAINPDKPQVGIGRKMKFSDIVDERLA